MTLTAFLELQQYQMENILVEHQTLRVNPELHTLEVISTLVPANHPIPPDVLPILTKLWTAQYYEFQSNADNQKTLLRNMNHSHRQKGRRPRRSQAVALMNRMARLIP